MVRSFRAMGVCAACLGLSAVPFGRQLSPAACGRRLGHGSTSKPDRHKRPLSVHTQPDVSRPCHFHGGAPAPLLFLGCAPPSPPSPRLVFSPPGPGGATPPIPPPRPPPPPPQPLQTTLTPPSF